MTIDLSEEFDEPAKPSIHYPPAEVDFDTAIWNFAEIIDTTGDYAYVLNLPLLGEAKMGSIYQRSFMDHFKTAKSPSVVTREDLQKKLNDDGLLYLGDNIEKCLPKTGHVIAFFTRLNSYDGPQHPSYEPVLKLRRDSNGKWSYRVLAGCPTPSVPSQKDWSGNEIISLQEADLGPYKKFLGYAALPYEGIVYHTRLTLSEARLAPFVVHNPAAKPQDWFLK